MLATEMRRQDASARLDPIPNSGRRWPAGQQPRNQRRSGSARRSLFALCREVTDTAQSNNTSFYSLDPRGLATIHEYGFEICQVVRRQASPPTTRALRMTQGPRCARLSRRRPMARLRQFGYSWSRDSRRSFVMRVTTTAWLQQLGDQRRHVPPDHGDGSNRRELNVRGPPRLLGVTPDDAVRASGLQRLKSPRPVQCSCLDFDERPGRQIRSHVAGDTSVVNGGNTRVTLRVGKPLDVRYRRIVAKTGPGRVSCLGHASR
jgi:hypothetical protein